MHVSLFKMFHTGQIYFNKIRTSVFNFERKIWSISFISGLLFESRIHVVKRWNLSTHRMRTFVLNIFSILSIIKFNKFFFLDYFQDLIHTRGTCHAIPIISTLPYTTDTVIYGSNLNVREVELQNVYLPF